MLQWPSSGRKTKRHRRYSLGVRRSQAQARFVGPKVSHICAAEPFSIRLSDATREVRCVRNSGMCSRWLSRNRLVAPSLGRASIPMRAVCKVLENAMRGRFCQGSYVIGVASSKRIESVCDSSAASSGSGSMAVASSKQIVTTPPRAVPTSDGLMGAREGALYDFGLAVLGMARRGAVWRGQAWPGRAR